MCSSVAVDGSLVVVVSSCPIIITVSPEKSGVQRLAPEKVGCAAGVRSRANREGRMRTHVRGLSKSKTFVRNQTSSHDSTDGDALQEELRSRRIIKMLLSLSVACASCRPALHVSAFPLLADATTSRHPPVRRVPHHRRPRNARTRPTNTATLRPPARFERLIPASTPARESC